jgi:hypothetical protein
MKITKIKIKNLFGIKEYEADGKSVELSGKNGVGKTSVIDAIRYALTNKSSRDYIVRNGENEGEILIETDNGLRIDRRERLTQASYKSVKSNGKEIPSPESFLRDIFTPLQLNPVEFVSMDKKKQNAMILDLIEFDWDMNTIRSWFGEIPDWVSYDQNILAILDDIQSEKGEYFQKRQNINRDLRNKNAFIEEIAASIPIGYQVDEWEKASAGDIYRQIETIRHQNSLIEKAKVFIQNSDNKIRGLQAEKEIAITAIERETANRENSLNKSIVQLEEQIKAHKQELASLSEKKQDKIALEEEKYKANVAKFTANLAEHKELASQKVKSIEELSKQAERIEEMKGHINEYRRMEGLQAEVEALQQESEELTEKITKARTLPGEILQTANIPIKGLSVKDGTPLINGLPISNLSDGEKLDLCIDVAIQKPNGLQIVLIDGVEKMATELRGRLYKKCKDKELQFIATRTTDSDDLTVVEL